MTNADKHRAAVISPLSPVLAQLQLPRRQGEPYIPIFTPAYLTGLYATLHTMASYNALSSPDSYTIAWIAALPIERAATEAILDEEYIAPTGFTRH